jgi:hydroxyethylthiazole kinase-like uncharacterized protein yjeF
MQPSYLPPRPPPQTRAAIREWDRRAIDEFGIPGIVLMENAGAGAARIIEEILSDPGEGGEPVRILCGPGNNGGDGFVVARHLHARRVAVEVVAASEEGHAPGTDSAVNFAIVTRLRIPLSREEKSAPRDGLERFPDGTIVDALFGTGLSRPLGPPFDGWVRAARESGRPVIALDIPSGLDADTGHPLGDAIVARHTITFAAPKIGFYLAEGPAHCGRIHVVDVGIPREMWE